MIEFCYKRAAIVFFFYMTVVFNIFNIMYWVNVFQSFLSPLKTFRCCRSFVSSVMFRYWKSLLIMSIKQVFLLPHFFFTLRRYSASAFFAGVSWSSFRRWPSHENLLFFVILLHFSTIVFSYNSVFFTFFGHLTPMTWRSNFRWKESILSAIVFVMVHNSLLYRKILCFRNVALFVLAWVACFRGWCVGGVLAWVAC